MSETGTLFPPRGDTLPAGLRPQGPRRGRPRRAGADLGEVREGQGGHAG